MRVVVNGKIQPFCYKLVAHEIEKYSIQVFNLIRKHFRFTKKSVAAVTLRTVTLHSWDNIT